MYTVASDQIKAVALVNSPCREVEILRDQANGNKVVSKSSIFEEGPNFCGLLRKHELFH